MNNSYPIYNILSFLIIIILKQISSNNSYNFLKSDLYRGEFQKYYLFYGFIFLAFILLYSFLNSFFLQTPWVHCDVLTLSILTQDQLREYSKLFSLLRVALHYFFLKNTLPVELELYSVMVCHSTGYVPKYKVVYDTMCYIAFLLQIKFLEGYKTK